MWDKVAVIWEDEGGEIRVLTYPQLDALVSKMAGVLKSLGVGQGDWVLFYAPPIPEVLALIHAAVKVGAPFEPVFTGWGWWALAKRVATRRPKLVVTADAFPRRGKAVKKKEVVARAVPKDVKVLVVERMGVGVERRRNDVFLQEVEPIDVPEGVVMSP